MTLSNAKVTDDSYVLRTPAPIRAPGNIKVNMG